MAGPDIEALRARHRQQTGEPPRGHGQPRPQQQIPPRRVVYPEPVAEVAIPVTRSLVGDWLTGTMLPAICGPLIYMLDPGSGLYLSLMLIGCICVGINLTYALDTAFYRHGERVADGRRLVTFTSYVGIFMLLGLLFMWFVFGVAYTLTWSGRIVDRIH